jgi:hypothetical protein
MRRLLLLACFALIARPALGQAPLQGATSCPAADSTGRDSTLSPAVRLDARVTAQSLRLTAPGSARVVFLPCAPGSRVVVDRGNLPERLEPGVTYRNVAVRVLIETDFVTACRLAAAIGAPGDSLPGSAACAAALRSPAAPPQR